MKRSWCVLTPLPLLTWDDSEKEDYWMKCDLEYCLLTADILSNRSLWCSQFPTEVLRSCPARYPKIWRTSWCKLLGDCEWPHVVVSALWFLKFHFTKITFYSEQTDLGITEDTLWKHVEVKTFSSRRTLRWGQEDLLRAEISCSGWGWVPSWTAVPTLCQVYSESGF